MVYLPDSVTPNGQTGISPGQLQLPASDESLEGRDNSFHLNSPGPFSCTLNIHKRGIAFSRLSCIKIQPSFYILISVRAIYIAGINNPFLRWEAQHRKVKDILTCPG